MVNPSPKDHIPLRMLTCLADSLSFLHALSTPPTSQQKSRSAKALWKVLCIPKVNFSRQNPPKKSDSLTPAPHPGKQGNGLKMGLVSLISDLRPYVQPEKEMLCSSENIHKGKRQTPFLPVLLHSPSSMCLQLKLIYFVDIYGTSIMHPLSSQVPERWLKQPLPLRSQKARPNYKTRIKRPPWPSHKT